MPTQGERRYCSNLAVFALQGTLERILILSLCGDETKTCPFWITSRIRTILDFTLLNLISLYFPKGGKWARYFNYIRETWDLCLFTLKTTIEILKKKKCWVGNRIWILDPDFSLYNTLISVFSFCLKILIYFWHWKKLKLEQFSNEKNEMILRVSCIVKNHM